MSEVSEEDREKAIRLLDPSDDDRYSGRLWAARALHARQAEAIADAFLAAGWRPAGVPAVDREKLAGDVGYPASPDDVDEAQSMDYAEGYARGFNNAFENVISSGVLRSEADVLHRFIDQTIYNGALGKGQNLYNEGGNPWLHEQVAAVLRGDGSAT